jgi:uncharacterized cupin superfamily protein
MGAPAGKTAHHVINTGSEDLRYLGISSRQRRRRRVSGFRQIRHRRRHQERRLQDRHLRPPRRTEKPLDYWDGEES